MSSNHPLNFGRTIGANATFRNVYIQFASLMCWNFFFGWKHYYIILLQRCIHVWHWFGGGAVRYERLWFSNAMAKMWEKKKKINSFRRKFTFMAARMRLMIIERENSKDFPFTLLIKKTIFSPNFEQYKTFKRIQWRRRTLENKSHHWLRYSTHCMDNWMSSSVCT